MIPCPVSYTHLDVYKRQLFLRELAGSDSAGILKRNDERFASCPRNLTMDTDKIKSYGIRFFNTSEGIRKCSMEHREMSQDVYKRQVL